MENGPSFKKPAFRGRLALIFVLVSMFLMLEAENISAQTAVAGNSGPICAGEAVVLYETGGDAVSWVWSSSGNALFDDHTLQSPTATGAVDGEVFTVRITDAVGSTAEATTRVTVFSAVPERPGQITGSETQCGGTTGVIYSIIEMTTATEYLWEVPDGIEITSGQGTASITVNIGPQAPASGTIRVYAINPCGASFPRSKNLTVIQMPAAAGPITGSAVFTPGTAGVSYSVDPIEGATGYLWAYSGAGVTINGNGSSSVTLDFASDATAGQLSVRGNNDCGDGAASYLDLISGEKILSLSSVFLEGLYSGSGIMSQAWNETGPQWPAGVADHISVELRDATNYSTVVWSLSDLPLSISGTAEINIPAAHSGSYYITIRHRNSIETTTAVPVSFDNSSIAYAFDSSSRAYGGNLKRIDETIDHYVIYGGDTNNDGIVDALDLIGTENSAIAFSSGYQSNDLNGDGIVDALDLILVENNALHFVRAIYP